MKSNKTLTFHLLALFVVAIWGGTLVNTKVLVHAGMSALEIFYARYIRLCSHAADSPQAHQGRHMA